MLFVSGSVWSGDLFHNHDPLLKTFIKNTKWTPDPVLQEQLMAGEAWAAFSASAGNWSVIFDESSMIPHVAYGAPLVVPGSDPEAVAYNFVNDHLSQFGVIPATLNYKNTVESSKYIYVNYGQRYNGLELLFSNVQVKMNKDLSVNLFRMNSHNNISIGTTPVLTESAAVSAAVNGVAGVKSATVTPDLKILPVPAEGEYEYHLVYEVMVERIDGEMVPAHYYTLVDAMTGDIMYRHNEVYHVANTDVNVTGTIYLTNPYDPTSVEPMTDLKVVVNGTTNYTDNFGNLNLSNTSPVSATFSLEGRWARVRTNNSVPTWTTQLQPGQNNILADNNANIKELSAFNSVNVVHNFMKSKFPNFTLLDIPLNTNIDEPGSCNAFYNGSSINFFNQGGGCNATSLVADVVYHEYGHGINDKFYDFIGANWQNGAMGEGYADIWALGITASPVLGIGFFQNDPNGFVRRYDVDRKVYPQDLVGQVHADGEIIAGAWWDTGLNLNDLQQMIDMFAETYFAGLTAADGNEGVLYTDILIEALMVDDNDGNLSNGTPNYCDITSAFAIHGISLSTASGFSHTELLSVAPQQPVTVNATIASLPAGSTLQGFYDINSSGTWTPFSFTNTAGTTYEGTIPAQPAGTIISYYMGIEDNCGTLVNVTPSGAADLDPNIPFFIMVGYNLQQEEDFDNFAGFWQEGLPSDNATTGIWTIDIPIPSFVGNGMVQTNTQVTPGGLFCAVTANAQNANSPAGEQDVDDGETTLISPAFDLSTYTDPAFTYYRWYSNDQGATPGTDFWQVAISGDGVNWVDVENTKVSDHGWRRFAFRVTDYITPTSTVYLRFIAEDANAGSLVEAAVDDIFLWDAFSTGIEENIISQFTLFPNPADQAVNLALGLNEPQQIEIAVYDVRGRKVISQVKELTTGDHRISLDLNGLEQGIYQVSLISNDLTVSKKLSVTR